MFGMFRPKPTGECAQQCPQCLGDAQVCNVCEKPGKLCKCRDEDLPTPMPCPNCMEPADAQ